MTNEIPFDEWTQIPNEELSKKGKAGWVYRPSNYPGPLAIDGFIKKEAIAHQWVYEDDIYRKCTHCKLEECLDEGQWIWFHTEEFMNCTLVCQDEETNEK